MAKFVIVSLLVSVNFLVSYSSASEWTDSNFQTNLAHKKKAFVMFFAPWCGHCKALKPTWDELSLKPAASLAAIVKVDCTEKGKDLCRKYGVSGYPTLKFFSYESAAGAEPTVIDYDGGRSLGELESYVVEHTQPSLKELSESDIDTFITSSHLPAVIGYFSSDKDPLFLKLSTLADKFRKSFVMGYTFSSEVAKKQSQTPESVVIYWPSIFQTKMHEPFVVTTTPTTLFEFLTKHKHSIVSIMTPANEKDFTKPIIAVYTSLDPVTHKSNFRQFRNRMITVAKDHSSVTFVMCNRRDYMEFIHEFDKEADEKAVYIVAFDSEDQKFVFDKPLSIKDASGFLAGLSTFVQNFLKGGDMYKPHIKTEPEPLTNDGPVKVVVGSTFKKIVLDETKDVLIEFYAPWCGHCKKLAPIYEDLAKSLADVKDLVIAKIDSTANEAPSQFKVKGFPTIFLVKAGQKNAPIMYDGDRTVKGFVEWLKEHSSFPITFDGPYPEVKEEL